MRIDFVRIDVGVDVVRIDLVRHPPWFIAIAIDRDYLQAAAL